MFNWFTAFFAGPISSRSKLSEELRIGLLMNQFGDYKSAGTRQNALMHWTHSPPWLIC
jgi:hypothetical protein